MIPMITITPPMVRPMDVPIPACARPKRACPARPRRSRLRVMDDAGWKVARLSEIPGAAELPGFSREEYLEQMKLRVVPHAGLGEGEQQEELYLVVEGRARFPCAGGTVELGAGEVLFARPGV